MPEPASKSTLTPEQERTLRLTCTALRGLTVYLESVLPVVRAEDEYHLKNLIGFGRSCSRKLVENFECVRAWEDSTGAKAGKP